MSPGLPGAHGDAVERHVLANGLTVLVRRDPSAPVAAIVTHVKSGYFDEPDEVGGVSHVLEHMYFKGTPSLGPGEIARETKGAGGYLNAGTIYDRTTYYTVLPSSGFEAGLAVQADAFANSLIDVGEFTREIEVIVEEERRKRDTPTAVATEECFALLHDVHRMRRWRIGHPEGLRRLSRDDVFRFYRAHYVPSNTILCIVGDVDPGTALREVERHYGELPADEVLRERGEPEPQRTGFRWRDITRDVEQTHSVMAWRTVKATDPDAPALDIAAAVLGAGRASRLYREVRERSLASGISAYHYTPADLGVFVVGLEAPADTCSAAVAESWSQVRGLAVAAPTPAEIGRVLRGVQARWARRMESVEGQATYLASWEAMGGWERGAGYLDALLSVSGAMVQDVAARYLKLDSSALVTLRPHSAVRFALDEDAALAALQTDRPRPCSVNEAAPIEAPSLIGLRVSAERVTSDVSVFRTDRGVPILTRRKHGAPIAYAAAMFRGGVAAETVANAGLTTLLARTALKGTTHRDGPRLAEDVENLGAALGQTTSAEGFGWSVSVPIQRLAQALTLLAEVTERPSLHQAALDTERNIALAGLAKLRDDMVRQPARLALAAAFGDHHYGRPALGTERGLASVDAGALRSWHERFVHDGDAVMVVVADEDPGEVAAMVRGAFGALEQGSLPRAAPARWPAGGAELSESRTREQTAISLMFPAPAKDDPRRRAAAMLATVASGLGGRFFEELRDRQSLAYALSVNARALPCAGWISGYIACSAVKEDAARAGLLREFMRLAEGPVSGDELARAKAYTLGSIAILEQSSAAVLDRIAEAWHFGTLDELAASEHEIRSLAAKDLWEVSRASFDPALAIWGVVRGTAEQR